LPKTVVRIAVKNYLWSSSSWSWADNNVAAADVGTENCILPEPANRRRRRARAGRRSGTRPRCRGGCHYARQRRFRPQVCRLALCPCQPLQAFAIIIDVAPLGVDYRCAVLIDGQTVSIGPLQQSWCTCAQAKEECCQQTGTEESALPGELSRDAEPFRESTMSRCGWGARFHLHGCCRVWPYFLVNSPDRGQCQF
jgi:hypothetical protein